MHDDLVADLLREYETITGARANWDSHWQEIADRVWPAHGPIFAAQGAPISTGEKRTREMFDATAASALRKFGAILDSLLTPASQKWHRVQASEPALNRIREVQEYFDEVSVALFKYRYAPQANFVGQNQMVWKSVGAFGTGALFVDALHQSPGLRYRNLHLSEVHFTENHQGVVDSFYRKFRYTARQAASRWPDRIPETIRSCLLTQPLREFDFVHIVRPRNAVDPSRRDYAGMPFASYYVSVAEKVLVEEGGYFTFPCPVSRYEQAPREIYGRSPAMDALPAIKTLNEEKKTVLKQGQRTVDPVLLAHDDGILDEFSLLPGAVNPGGVTADGRVLVHPLPVGNIAIGKDLMDDERVVINDVFLVTLFQILVETPQMTATEVLERVKEKGILLAPPVGRQQSEYLGPLIEREIDVLTEQGLLPPMPGILIEARGEYRVEYDSPLSRAQRAEEAAGLMRVIETTLQVVNVTQNPAPLDHFDWDVIVPELAAIHGVTPRWLRSLEAVQEIRQSRAAEAEQMATTAAAPGAAALAKAAMMGPGTKRAA